MKRFLILFAITGFIGMTSILSAETSHEHALMAGPKGGRILENTEPHAEFFVEKDKTIAITFYDDALQPVPVADQSVLVIAEANGTKTKLEFEKKDNALVSKEKLPESHGLNLVVQFRQTPDTKPVNYRFLLEDTICGECNRAEYACICAH